MADTKSRSTADTQTGVTRGNCFVIWPPARERTPTLASHWLHLSTLDCDWTKLQGCWPRELFYFFICSSMKLSYWFWVYSWKGNNPLRRNNQNNEPSWSPLKCSFWFQQLLSSWTVRVCVCLLNTGIEREDQTREASLRSLSVHIQGNVCTLLALTYTTLKIQRRVGG